MNLEQMLAQLEQELRTLADKDTLTDGEATRWDEAMAEARELRDKIAEQDAAEERAAKRETERKELADAIRSGRVQATPGAFDVPNVNKRDDQDPFDLSDLRFNTTGAELRGRATTAIERAVGDLEDGHREAATKVLRSVKDPHGVLSRRILATGSESYRSAFQKVAGGQGHLLDSDERQALARAQSLTDAAGGFAIPFTLDPTIIMTNDGAANPFRQVSRIEQIVTDTWNGVSSAGVTGGYAAEGSEVGDDSATLAQPSVKPERWDVFVPFSFEVGMDWANLESDLRMMVSEKRDEFDTVAFTTGSGSDEPTGFVTDLDGTASEIAPATAETFAIEDVYNLMRQLPPRYRRTADQAGWMGEIGTANEIRQFDTSGGADLWAYLGAGTPERLLGFRWFENSEMDSTVDINAAATADNFPLAIGDWSNFLIVDRIGLNMELVPHLFATANNRPSGQRGFLAWGRTGSGVLNINAFRLLSIPTTA